MTVTGLNGITYRLSQAPISGGGEGYIHSAVISRIAKVYKPGILTPDLENKLKK